MTVQTMHTIRAAQHYRQWGARNAKLYCLKRGIDLRLLRLARQLQASDTTQ